MTTVVSDAVILEICTDEAVLALTIVDAQIAAFVAELGRANAPLPERFTVDDPKWIEARERIEIAAGKRDLTGTIDACIEYKARAAKYLDGWRVKLNINQPQRKAA
jgi:hypothetical protein